MWPGSFKFSLEQCDEDVGGRGAQEPGAEIQVSEGAERRSEVTNRPHDTWGGFTPRMALM